MSARFVVMLTKILAFQIAITHCYAAEFSQQARQTSWFQPTLEKNEDPQCAALLRELKNVFSTDAAFSTLADPYRSKSVGDLETMNKETLETESYAQADANVAETGYRIENHIVTIDGQRVYLTLGSTPGCGGACEGAVISASSEPQRPADYRGVRNGGAAENIKSVYGHGVNFLRNPQGDYYAISESSPVMELQKLTSKADWKLVCSFRVAPESIGAVKDKAVLEALDSTDALMKAVQGVRGNAGDCGTSRTHDRWTRDIREALNAALYRPWSITDWSTGDSSSEIDMRYLEQWALTGLAEHDALTAYKMQLEATAGALGKFYQTRFKVDATRAKETARTVLQTAVSIGIRFYGYEPLAHTDDQELRAAILENRSLPTFTLQRGTKHQSPFDGSDFLDDLVALAIRRPDVVKELLLHGADPNSINAFGKTPLMYAAQQNELESARILLANGADPNMQTFMPGDRCFYTLSTRGVTALHYAARYATADFIKLLLDHGAASYAQVIRDYNPDPITAGPYPIDWLKRYAEYPTERNSNIADAEIIGLQALLRVPDKNSLQELARKLTLESETHYRSKNFKTAYVSLRNAMHTGNASLQTYSDMSLIGLRAGQVGEALQATHVLINNKESSTMAATGWFNRGLICQQQRSRVYEYNGQYYCFESTLYTYLRAWELGKTRAARDKVNQLFESSGACTKSSPSGAQRSYYAVTTGGVESVNNRQMQRIYIRHEPKDSIEPVQLTWKAKIYSSFNSQPKDIDVVPTIVSRETMDKFVITVMQSEYSLPTVANGNAASCDSFP